VRQVEYGGKLGRLSFHGTGYEIHYGNVVRNGEKGVFSGGYPVSSINDRANILGTNVHGLLENNVIFRWITGMIPDMPFNMRIDQQIEKISDQTLATLKRDHIMALVDGI